MSKFFTITLTALLLCLCGATQGQGYTSHWVFGDGIHLEFDETGPTVMPTVEHYIGYEGTSCISDEEGNLLYYSNVTNVWNRNFSPLFNSDTLPAIGYPPGSSKTNGSLFLPWPGDLAERYVAFLAMNDADDKLYFSKIDQFLDGGLGGIVDSIKYKLLWDKSVSEHLNAVKHANGRDWWIVGRGQGISDEINLALLTPDGIVDAGSKEAGYFGHDWGAVVFSPSGNLMALTTMLGSCASSPSAVALYYFDRCEGNLELIDTLITRTCGQSAYGVAFSTDGNRLYYSTAGRPRLYQATLVGDQLVDTLIFELLSSAFVIIGGNIVLASDTKVYFSFIRGFPNPGLDTLSQYLGVVNNPNVFGMECQLDTFGLFLGGAFNVGLLPNFANYDLGPLVGSPCDTLSPVDTTQTSIPVFPQGTTTWSVIPTISEGLFTVQGATNGKLVVYDLYGREVFRKSLTNARFFDLSAHPAGLYWVTIQSDDGIWYPARKIIRQ